MSVAFYNIPPGIPGTEETVRRMLALVNSGKVHPEVMETARILTQGLPNKDYHAEAEKLFRFVRDNIRYQRDPRGVEYVRAPNVVLKKGVGDCDDAATLYAALAESVGLPTGFEAIKADPGFPYEFTHIYPIVRTHKWYAADTTTPGADFGWRPQAGVFGRRRFMNY